MRKSAFITIAAGVFLATILIAGSVSVVAKDSPNNDSNKARLTIGKIKPKAGKCTSGMAKSFAEMLDSVLTNTGRFIVLADQDETGGAGAEILITGAITTFEPNAKSGGLGKISKQVMGKVGVSKKTAKIKVELKIIDISSGKKIKGIKVEGKSNKFKARLGSRSRVHDVTLVGDLNTFSNEPMEKAIRAVLAKAVDEITEKVPNEYYRYAGPSEEEGQSGETPSGGTSSSRAASTANDMTLYTKYDFVPGNKVIFYDDMQGEEEGEFPYRWNLDKGVFEVVRLGQEYWILATDKGSIRPKMPDAPLPDKYTVELEFYDNGQNFNGNYFYIHWVDAAGKNIGNVGIVSSATTWLTLHRKQLASKTLPNALTKGLHTIRIMATSRSIKCYIDQERIANVPKIDGFDAVGFRLSLRPYRDADNPALFRGFRFAEGGKSMREQLDEDGKIVTHGILFDPGSYVIKGESFKTLKNIGRLFEDDPGLRLSIEGHTDSDGSDEQNVTLSQNRAKAVLEYLISNFDITGDQLESRGWGESKPVGPNDTSEGKANNRRVELVKL